MQFGSVTTDDNTYSFLESAALPGRIKAQHKLSDAPNLWPPLTGSFQSSATVAKVRET